MSLNPVTFAPARFAHQPLKALYITLLFLGLFIHHPIWVVRHFLRLQPYPRSWTLLEGVSVQALRYLSQIIPACDFKLRVSSRLELPMTKFKHSRAIWIPAASDEWIKEGSIAKDELCLARRCPGYVYGQDSHGEGEMKVEKGENILLWAHGGAYLIGNATETDATAQVPLQLLERCPSTLQHVLSIDYTKVHDAPFPAHLLDAISAYSYLVSELGIAPSNVIVGGDSAGSGVMLGLLRYLRDDMQVDEMPRAALLLSPSCDISEDLTNETKPSEEIELRARQDYLNRAVYKQYMTERLLRHHPRSMLSSPYLSPASRLVPATEKLFKLFPKTFITCGGVETFRHSIEELGHRMELGGVDLKFHLEPNAIHDYEIIPFWNKGSRERTFDMISRWIDETLETSPPVDTPQR